jgi:hypothetical protein
MENTLVLFEDISVNLFQPFDLSTCNLIDLSNLTIENPVDNEVLQHSECIKNYYYYVGNSTPPPSSGLCDTFLHIYHMNTQFVTQNTPVIFESNQAISGNCSHIPSSSQIFISRTGWYSFYTHIQHIEHCQFALFKNFSVIVPASTFGSSISSHISNTCILQITADDLIMESPNGLSCIVELINTTPDIPYVTLPSSTYNNPQINASISLFFLHN